MSGDFYCIDDEKLNREFNFIINIAPYYYKAKKSTQHLRINKNLKNLLEESKQFLGIPFIRNTVDVVEKAYGIGQKSI